MFVKLCAFIQQHVSKYDRDYLVSGLTNHSLKAKDLERIVDYLYKDEKYNEQDQLAEIWNAIKKVPKLLKAYDEKYKKTNYKTIL